MRVVATIEARMGSSRLPGKVMLPLGGMPMLGRLIERLNYASEIDEVQVITSTRMQNQIISKYCKYNDINCFMGSENDIIKRIIDSQKSNPPDYIVQLTGDNPLIDPEIIDKVIKCIKKYKCDYVDTSLDDSVIIGLNVRCFSFKALKKIDYICKDKIMRSHGGFFIKKKKTFDVRQIKLNKLFFNKNIRLTLDEPDDYFVICNVFESLKHIKPYFKAIDILDLYKKKKKIFFENINVKQKKPNEK